MQELGITIFLLFLISSTCSSSRLFSDNTNIFNVIDYAAVGDGKTDDSQAFLKAWSDFCEEAQGDPIFHVPSDKQFMLQPLTFAGPCNSNSPHVQIKGVIVAPKFEDWRGVEKDKWISFEYINGLIVDGGGKIDGQGSSWWDACGHIDLSSCQRPSALSFHKCDNLQLMQLSHLNSGRNHISINACDGANVSHLHIVAPDESPNTDGIDISASTHVNIQSSLMQTGDDCIAINNGSFYINITDVMCGPGHGISVGSLGKDGAYATVAEIHVRNCTLNGTQNGVRIKTWQGGSGYARNISFEDITLHSSRNPIIIDQHYSPNRKRGRSLQISDVTYRNVRGSSADERAIILNCSNDNGCKNIVMDQIEIKSSIPGAEAYAVCNNAHGESRITTPGVSCLS